MWENGEEQKIRKFSELMICLPFFRCYFDEVTKRKSRLFPVLYSMTRLWNAWARKPPKNGWPLCTFHPQFPTQNWFLIADMKKPFRKSIGPMKKKYWFFATDVQTTSYFNTFISIEFWEQMLNLTIVSEKNIYHIITMN